MPLKNRPPQQWQKEFLGWARLTVHEISAGLTYGKKNMGRNVSPLLLPIRNYADSKEASCPLLIQTGFSRTVPVVFFFTKCQTDVYTVISFGICDFFLMLFYGKFQMWITKIKPDML